MFEAIFELYESLFMIYLNTRGKNVARNAKTQMFALVYDQNFEPTWFKYCISPLLPEPFIDFMVGEIYKSGEFLDSNPISGIFSFFIILLLKFQIY